MLLNNLPSGSTFLSLSEEIKINSHFREEDLVCVYFSYFFFLSILTFRYFAEYFQVTKIVDLSILFSIYASAFFFSCTSWQNNSSFIYLVFIGYLETFEVNRLTIKKQYFRSIADLSLNLMSGPVTKQVDLNDF